MFNRKIGSYFFVYLSNIVQNLSRNNKNFLISLIFEIRSLFFICDEEVPGKMTKFIIEKYYNA